MGTKPTHEQAQLHLQVYDLRREAKLRYNEKNLQAWKNPNSSDEE